MVVGPGQGYNMQTSIARNRDEIPKNFEPNLVFPLFLLYDKQHFVDMEIALPIEIAGCISYIG